MEKKKKKLGLLPAVVIAIAAGIICGQFFPDWAVRIFLTFNGLFGNFLSFIIPLLIVGLVAPGIADLGKSAGRLLLITTVLAYLFTLTSGFFTYLAANWVYPVILDSSYKITSFADGITLTPYFTVAMPPLMDVMTALVLAFMLGLGMAVINGNALKEIMRDFRDIINKVIVTIIIPLLPIYIFGIFLNMTISGQVVAVMGVFLKIIILIFIITLIMLLMQFILAGVVSKQNPFRLFKNMLPAYATALGTQSSAATIPVTLAQTQKNGVREEVAGFVVPLCATIHLSGSTMKIVACAMAIMMMSDMPITLTQFAGFIFMLGIAMVAAPGVPGGAIMAALGILQSILGFNEAALALIIALYIAMDSFGTACNVTGDGAIAVIINKIYKGKKKPA